MNSIALNNLWSYLQGLSLSASNQRWLGERLIAASAAKAVDSEEEMKLNKLQALYGAWSDDVGGEQMERAVMEARAAGYERELVGMDE